MIPILIAGYRPRETEAGARCEQGERDRKKREKEGNVIGTKCRDNAYLFRSMGSLTTFSLFFVRLNKANKAGQARMIGR